MSIYGLPFTVWAEICNNVHCKKTLASLSVSSKAFHIFAEYPLYSTLAFSSYDGPAICKLIRAISYRPELASYVEELFVDVVDKEDSGGFPDFEDFDLSSLERRDFKHARKWIRRELRRGVYRGREFGNWYLDKFVRTGPDRVIPLLLVLFSRSLKSFKQSNCGNMNGWPTVEWFLKASNIIHENISQRPSEFVGDDLQLMTPKRFNSRRGAQITSHYLSRLSEINQDFTVVGFGDHLDVVLPYLRLHSVRTYRGSKIEHNYAIQEETFQLTNLILEETLMGPFALLSFLTCFQTLRLFSLENTQSRRDYDENVLAGCEDFWVSSGAIIKGLARSSETLQELNLTILEDPRGFSRIITRLESLSGLKSLR